MKLPKLPQKWHKKIILSLGCTLAVLFIYDSFLPPISTLMLARYVTFSHTEREFVPLSHISRSVIRAVIAAEDGQFCNHAGVDTKALQRELRKVTGMTRGEAKGASTITMQTVKNLFLWNGRSFIRKGLEIPLAYVIDLVWSKSHILETYLNIAEFGEGIFGVEAASQHYFHTSARNLNAGQAALLAASLPNPLERNPAKPSHYVRAYANAIGARMGHDVPLECLK